jgi:hypothetical protein
VSPINSLRQQGHNKFKGAALAPMAEFRKFMHHSNSTTKSENATETVQNENNKILSIGI